jgi:DNA-binding NarL/FixJ family response regulator
MNLSVVSYKIMDSLPKAGDIRPRTPPDTDGQCNIRLPEDTVLRLEQLRQQTGKKSIAEVIVEAAELYASMQASEPQASDESVSKELTARNREVLRLVADGISTKGIAARLKISVKTAEFHRAKLMKKLGVRGVAGLVRFAIRTGVVLP